MTSDFIGDHIRSPFYLQVYIPKCIFCLKSNLTKFCKNNNKIKSAHFSLHQVTFFKKFRRFRDFLNIKLSENFDLRPHGQLLSLFFFYFGHILLKKRNTFVCYEKSKYTLGYVFISLLFFAL